MTMTTRSGRITKPTAKAQQATNRATSRRPPPRGPAKKANRAVKERPRTSQLTAVQRPATSLPVGTLSISSGGVAPAQQASLKPSNTAVERTETEGWASSPLHISFVYNSNLPTSQDTETIALNLIDHTIKPENWNPELRYNILSAACFFFSSILTGGHISPDQISKAILVDPQLVLQVAATNSMCNPALMPQLVRALEVSPQDIERGYEIIHGQRTGFRDIVGRYADKLNELPTLAQLREANHARGSAVGSTIAFMGNFGNSSATSEAPHSGEEMQQILPPVTSHSDVPGAAEHGLDAAATIRHDATDSTADGGEEGAAVPVLKVEEEKASEVDLDLFELDEFDTFVAENE